MSLPPRLDQAYVDSLLSLVAATGSDTSSATDPCTGEPLPPVPQSSATDVAEAATRARLAQTAWAARPLAERVTVVLRFARLALQHRERLLDVVQWETGKSRLHATIELLGLPAVAVHYGTHAPAYLAETKAASGHSRLGAHPRRASPQGLVGVIAPWNYPLSWLSAT